MDTLSDAAQEYLESIYWLYESGIERTQANLARALRVSQPSASEMLGGWPTRAWSSATTTS